MSIKTETQNLRSIFDEASEIADAAERRAFVEKACGGNSALLREVGELLTALDAADGYFDGITPAPRLPVAEEKIGNFRLVEKLGEGGGGMVYLAEQWQPVRRRVALKILKPGMDTRSVIARFEAERQALALMDHPGIARVFDAGTSPNGRPYFVMELVSGVRITSFCDEHRLETSARLELFIQVCQAVQHAHQKGIIHRDLKPSNILVTPAASEGVAPAIKVIDFGIAKATADLRLTDKTLVTHAEWIVGTPAYMSPEQAELGAAEIDTRSDIYSLGVLLYELLTGRPPFESAALLESGIDAMRRTLRETEPQRPSTRLAALNGEALTELARRHRAEPARLVSVLRGDLDWIVLKALEKDPARRYESASGLAADVQRYLRHEPVEARPPSALYGLAKLVRRHRTAFATAVGVAVLLLVASIISIRLAFRAWKAEGEQRGLRVAAESARKEAENRAEENRRHVVRSDVTQANQLVRDGDFTGALLPLVEALRLDESVGASSAQIQRRRLGSLLRQTPRLLECWSFSGNAGHAVFSRDRQQIIALNDGEVRVTDPKTGLLIGQPFRLDAPAVKVWLPLPGRALVADAEGRLRWWNTSTRQPIGAWMETRSSPSRGTDFFRDRWDVSTDGRWLLAPTKMGAQLFDVETAEPVGPLLLAGKLIHQLQFSPDGRSVFASCGGQGFLQIEVPSGNVIWSAPFDGRKPATSFAISSDGTKAALALGRSIENLELWDLAEKKLIRQLASNGYFVDVAFTPDGRRLVAGTRAQTQVFDCASGAIVGEPVQHRSFVTGVTISPDGKTFASTTYENVTRLYDVATGQPRSPRLQHPGRVEHLEFGADGQQILTRSQGGFTRLWDLSTAGAVQRTMAHERGVSAVEYSRDGRLFLTCSGDRTACLWETATGRLVARLTHAAAVVSGRFSPDGKRLVTGAQDGGVHIWEAAESGAVVATARQGGTIRGVEFSPDGQFVLSWSEDKSARLWNANTGEPVGEPMLHATPIWCAAFSPDGRRIATGAGGEAHLWDAANGRRMFPPIPHRHAATAVVFDSTSRQLITAELNRIRTFSVESGQPIGAPIESIDVTSNLQISPDGNLLIAASWLASATVYDLRTGKPAAPMIEHAGKVSAASFSPDGAMILTVSEDETARVWETASGQPVTPPLRHRTNVPVGSWSADGAIAATGAANGVARFWDVAPTADSLESMRLNSELLSARKLQAGGEIIALTTAEMEERWKQFRQLTPAAQKP